MENNNLIYNLNNKIIILKNDIFFLDANTDLNYGDPTGLYQKKKFPYSVSLCKKRKVFQNDLIKISLCVGSSS